MRGQLLKPVLKRILYKLKSDLLNPKVYWGGPLWKESCLQMPKERWALLVGKAEHPAVVQRWVGAGEQVWIKAGAARRVWRRAAGVRSWGVGSLRGAWRHVLSSGLGAGAVFQAWVWYPGGNCQKESHQAAMGHARCPPTLGIPRYSKWIWASEEVPLVFQVPWWRIAPMELRSEC